MQEVVGEVNQAEIATVERLRREGKGLSAIAQETGISINTMYVERGIPAAFESVPKQTAPAARPDTARSGAFRRRGGRDSWAGTDSQK